MSLVDTLAKGSQVAVERTVITLLRSNQYQGLDSFSNVGDFVPLEVDRKGIVLREVAPTQFRLALPEQPGEAVWLWVALIRDWRQPVPVPSAAHARPPAWDADLSRAAHQQWLAGEWVATAAPVAPTQPKLIPVVSTASALPPIELVAVYGRRWVAQENIIRDFLLPLGLDTNHGYAKTPVDNSEVTKRRAKLQKQLDAARRHAEKAQRQHRWNAQRAQTLFDQIKRYGDEQYEALYQHALALPREGDVYGERDQVLHQEKRAIDLDLHQRWQEVYRTQERQRQAHQKHERASAQQRELLRDL